MEKEFKYNGYTFRPIGKMGVSFRLRRDKELGISAYEWSKGEKYDYDKFYEASGNSRSDLFLCIENGNVYIPCINELFLFE